jgi:2-oxoglutarate ferredoxin oxidoreductase subunit alpha
MTCDITIRISGEAGQGMNVISSLLGKTFVRNGLWTFINQDAMSRIRGGNNYSQIRISNYPVRSLSSQVDILVCLDKNSLDIYKDTATGIIIYDPGKMPVDLFDKNKFVPVPLEKIAEETGKNPKMGNTVASGAVLALLGLSPNILFDLLTEMFSGKGTDIVSSNRACAQAGFDYITRNYKQTSFCKLVPDTSSPKKMLITGSQAVALGALASNLRFYAAYPMSPSTSVMEYLSSKQKDYELVVEQAEDEIAAINMSLGASFCGARAMTGTSGGGLALMVEGISLAGMTETPIVIMDAQRPAPATGLPTRTEQADLLFVAHAGHGEFPRVILAPGTAKDAVELTKKAFYLADKYQIPVFLLTDQYLADSSWTVETINLGNSYTQSMLTSNDSANMPQYGYRRYEITDSGISPRIRPGTAGQVLYADSDEHTEEGHITESAVVRKMMVDKRLRKYSGLLNEMSLPVIYPSDEKIRTYIVCWGSTLGVVEEAVSMLNKKNVDTGYIHFTEMYPIRNDAIPVKILSGSKLIAVENNATGQFVKLLKMETGIDIKSKILKYDGRPFTPQELVNEIEKINKENI